VAAGGGVTELAPGVHSLGTGKGGQVHAFLLEHGDLTLVDTLFENDARGVLSALHALGRSPRDLTRIVLTHAHRSHLGGLAALRRATGARILAHEWEADIVSGERRAQPVTLLPKQSLRIWPFQLGIWLGRPKHAPCAVDDAVGEGDEIGPLRVLHAPGHTPGHLAFFWPERSLLLAGDAIATWPEFCPGWEAFNLNEEQQAESLRRMAALDARIVGVGHGDPITEDAAARVRGLVPDTAAPTS
jgi:glyoxylase-like metal-dependent hydrolase (beta-lactamase superfamily II)